MKEYAIEKHDLSRINKLEQLTDITTFWNDVRKLIRNTTTDHALRRWQVLSEIRYQQLKQGA